MADARAPTLPVTSIARSRACMAGSIRYHVRDYEPNTLVMQGPFLITGVNTIAERLKSARLELGLNQSELAKAAGVRQGTIGNIESGIRKNPRELLSISRALGVNPEWLANGKGPRSVADPQNAHPVSDAPGHSQVAHQVSLNSVETVSLMTWEQLMSEDRNGALPHVFRVGVPDNSMMPDLKPGALIVMDSREVPRPGDGVLIRDKSGQIHLRQYRAGRPGVWEAHAKNPAYAPLESERDGLQVLAVLMGVLSRWG